jgi:two-component system, chemotaxis family, CheB/CheR fusion protein
MPAGEALTEPAEQQLQDILSVLRSASGIDFTQYKPGTVKRRLLRRMALHRMTDVAAYLRYLREQPAEATALSQDLLIQVTRFFREPDSFRALAEHVFPAIADQPKDDPIRIWVPGCATGEEPYSIAIVLAEFLADPAPHRRVQIFATDVSEAAVDVARSGIYPPGIAADVSAERLERFFQKADGGYRIAKPLRDMCVFARHDISRDPPFSRLDLIVCRNVLIYLDVAVQKRLMSAFHYALKPHGVLMLGAAETPGAQAPFSTIDKKWRIYRKSAADRVLPMTFRLEPRSGRLAGPAPSHQRQWEEAGPLHEDVNRLLLEKYCPPGVIVDAEFQVVQFRGHTGPYLEPASGTPSLDVFKMARDGLLHPLRTALQNARRRRRPSRKEGVAIQDSDGWREINLEVVPLAGGRRDHFLVLFEEVARPPAATPGKGAARRTRTRAEPPAARARLGELRRELAASREYLQSIVQELEAANEELQSANEEILSSNEELQSTNEELDTAKEELQSTNEELNTVNEELHGRNEELVRVNSDLVNLLASVDFPIVIVDENLRVRRFTPTAEEQFNLIASDVGRPIGQITHNFAFEGLEAMIRETLRTLAPQQRDVQDRSGRWFSLRLRPYKGVDNRIDGAVIAAIDVGAAKLYEAQLEHARNHFVAIVETVREPLLVLDAELRVLTANRSFYQTFRVSPAETEATPIYELGGGQWNVPAFRQLLERIKAGESAVDFTVEAEFPALGRRRMAVNARPIDLADDRHGILVALEDLTDAPVRT